MHKRKRKKKEKEKKKARKSEKIYSFFRLRHEVIIKMLLILILIQILIQEMIQILDIDASLLYGGIKY